MFDFILKRILRLPKIERLESFLFVGPHPDDIEVSCAPTVKKLTEAGKRVVFLIATDGRMGSTDPARWGEPLARLRREEAAASAKLLGVNEIFFLPFEDAGAYTADECARALAKEIVRLRPDAVFGPDPDVRSEFHADHIKTGQAIKYACCMAPHPAVMESLGCSGSHSPALYAFYNTERPNAFVRVARQIRQRAAALACHTSQFDEQAVRQIALYYRLRSIRLGLFRRLALCDGYRAVTPARAHCLPEASKW